MKDASMVTKTQESERDEKLEIELRHWSERAKKAEASNERLTRINGQYSERIVELEDERARLGPAPEHVQRTLEQFERREADLRAEVEALRGERDGLQLEVAACRETAEELKAAVRAEPGGTGAQHSIRFDAVGVRLQFNWDVDERSRREVAAFERAVIERALRSGFTVDEIARVVAEYPPAMAGWPEQIAIKDLVRYRELARRVARMLGVALQDPPDVRTVQTGNGQEAQIIVGAANAEAAERFTREADPWGLCAGPGSGGPRLITYSEQGGLGFSWELDRESREAVQAFEAHLSKRIQEEIAEAVRAETERLQDELASVRAEEATAYERGRTERITARDLNLAGIDLAQYTASPHDVTLHDRGVARAIAARFNHGTGKHLGALQEGEICLAIASARKNASKAAGLIGRLREIPMFREFALLLAEEGPRG